jgi:hypothetical protein
MWSLLAMAHAGCDAASLEAVLAASEDAFAKMSDDIDATRERVSAELGCQSAAIRRPLAGAVHRAYGLYAFLDGNDPAVAAHFARYRQLVPGASLPDALAPREHPLRQAFAGGSPPSSTVAVQMPAEGWVLVDGEQEQSAPADLPWVHQHLSADGRVLSTRLIPPGGRAPDLGRPAAVVDVPSPSTPRSGVGRRIQVNLGVGSLVLGSALYVSAFASRAGYERAVDDGDADLIRSRHGVTNALTVVGLGTALAGGGLVVSGALGGGR